MTRRIYFLGVLGLALASPAKIDWSKVKRGDAFLEPISNSSLIPETRISGGVEAEPFTFGFVVGLLADGLSFCGGSLISEDAILTAAHCTIRASFVRVILGAHNIQIPEPSQIVIASNHIINHPDYDPAHLANDIAIIRIPEPAPLDDYIRIVTLPPPEPESYEGFAGVFVGWGKLSEDSPGITAVLHHIYLTVISNEVCAFTYGEAIHRSVLCTSGVGGIGICSGDSGGPLISDSHQIGVASFISPRGCESGSPSGFTRVSEYRKWIDKVAFGPDEPEPNSDDPGPRSES